MLSLSPSGGYNLPPLSRLILWRDPIARRGIEAMAADEALLEWGDQSVLRAYKWGVPTITYGYFDLESTARDLFQSDHLQFVRRWTGGGIVDHRNDIPFTLALHRHDPERATSASLYRWIHGALTIVLRECGVPAILLDQDAPNGGRACFASPVASDIILSDGTKLAGGGQRRARNGVLHQGSIQNCQLPEGWDEALARRLCDELIIIDDEEPFEGFQQRVEELLSSKYDLPSWAAGVRRGKHA